LILIGAAMGAVNGALVGWLRLPSIIVTLAMLVAWRDALRWITGGEWVQSLPANFQWFGLGQSLGQWLIVVMALIGTLAFEFQVTIPLMAHSAFHLGATGFGLLYAAMGAGAVVSGVTLAGKLPGRVRTLAISAAAFGIALGAAALVPTPAGAAICLAVAGAASVVYSSSTNGTLQIRADPSMRGRVVALYIMAFMGSTAVGGPLVGVVGQVVGPRASLWVGALGCAAAVLLALAYELRERGRRQPARTQTGAVAAG